MIAELFLKISTVDNYGSDCDFQATNEDLKNMLSSDYNYSTISFNKPTENECRFTAELLDSNGNDIDEKYLINNHVSKNMFILVFNLEETDMMVEDELRYWMIDSNNIWKNENITKEEKLALSPIMNFGILVEGKRFELINCKLFETYSNRSFAVLVEKII